MDQCVWVLHILKAIHACPNATWKVCSHISASKKRESWHKRDTPWSENSEEEKIPPQSCVDTYSRGFIWDAGLRCFTGWSSRHCVSQCSLQKTTQITLLYWCRYEAKHSIISLLCQRFINMCDMCDVHIFWGLKQEAAVL